MLTILMLITTTILGFQTAKNIIRFKIESEDTDVLPEPKKKLSFKEFIKRK